MTDTKRLNKFISETGFCSRREADKYIESGKVTINGFKAEVGTQVCEGDVVKVNDRPLKEKPKAVYIAYNKPVGVTCTTERKIQSNIIRAINYPERIFPIGRLDRPSEGLIFLTNEGDIVNKILRAGNNHDKEYVVKVDKPLNNTFVQKMSNGIPILGTVTKKCTVKKIDKDSFSMILTQGLNRQIRRMCEYLGYEVITLQRTRIMNVTLKGLAVGKWRYLTESEMQQINGSVKDSGKTEEHSIDLNKRHQKKSFNNSHKNDNKKLFNKDKTSHPKRNNDSNKSKSIQQKRIKGTLSLKK
ncbi:23S rRNA pseudouridine synthase F [Pseudoalteromonas sp. NBT06-2]|uniref:23S rRNA pseudouridine(2604) synthase RluF n=1 Tax=Pseudoalteromonas sp. NBT06-2 TaxID=2025950 RepID=UPI000BA6D9B3|nr:23S rRNA pseudouridine(2604) synthase RluF [Pseudoalteromonas sp. NBT06-2]PAJ76127.1 23S rRNA pseudouridine synthase F [Pseudoalteromonas sp. NBT06-2]